jgi:integrase
MSVYRPKGQEVYVYDFWHNGDRFSGSTGFKSKREALAVESQRKDEAKRAAREQAARDNAPMTLDIACDRYWVEIGQYAKSSRQIEAHLDYLLKRLGEKTRLEDITTDKVAELIAKRRAEKVDNIMKRKAPKKGTVRAPAKRVSNSTVNRSTLEPLKRILFRARDVWGQKVAPIEWKKHRLGEPQERVRTLFEDEEARFFAKLPEMYHPIAYFAMRTGCRAAECTNLKREDIDWGARTITIVGKGGITKTIPLPLDVRDRIFGLEPSPDGHVFSLPATGKGGGQRPHRAVSYRAYSEAVRTALKRAGVKDFRLHDLRHTAGTRLLKSTGNIKMVAKLLRHSNIKTTAKYAHVFDDELRDALDQMPSQKVPGKIPAMSNKSLNVKKKA